MNRREFVAGSLAGGLAASAMSPIGAAWAQSGPLTKIIFPFAAGGSGDMLCRQLGEYLPAATCQHHRAHGRDERRREQYDWPLKQSEQSNG